MKRKIVIESLFSSSPIIPSLIQRYLLNCCLANNKEFFATNWKHWKSQQNFEVLDYESFKLVPLLNEQLLKYHIEDENQPRYQGIYKKYWVNNIKQFSELPVVLNQLKEANILFKVIKNVAFTKMFYQSDGLLKIDGGDVFIRSADVAKTIDVLMKYGYFLNNPLITISYILKHHKFIKQISFINRNNHQIVLHLHLFSILRPETVENEFWNNGLSFKLNNTSIPTFNHTQHLFYTIINAVSETSHPMLQWIVDVKAILKTKQIDWEEFIFYTKNFNVGLLADFALNYLCNIHKLDIPENVLNMLSAVKLEKAEILEFNNFIRKNKTDKLRYTLSHYRQLKNNTNYNIGYIEYLKLRLDANTVLEMLKKITGKLLK
jgi:hypothetical protein